MPFGGLFFFFLHSKYVCRLSWNDLGMQFYLRFNLFSLFGGSIRLQAQKDKVKVTCSQTNQKGRRISFIQSTSFVSHSKFFLFLFFAADLLFFLWTRLRSVVKMHYDEDTNASNNIVSASDPLFFNMRSKLGEKPNLQRGAIWTCVAGRALPRVMKMKMKMSGEMKLISHSD